MVIETGATGMEEEDRLEVLALYAGSVRLVLVLWSFTNKLPPAIRHERNMAVFITPEV
jgi:hypothetical protein